MKAEADPIRIVASAGRTMQMYCDATRGHLSSNWNWLAPVYQSRVQHEQDPIPLVGANAN
jgi:hypothetical protein